MKSDKVSNLIEYWTTLEPETAGSSLAQRIVSELDESTRKELAQALLIDYFTRLIRSARAQKIARPALREIQTLLK